MKVTEVASGVRTFREERWYIYYKIPRLTGDQLHRVGPYSDTELRYHRDDIAGYDGVTDVRCDTK